MFRTIGQAVTNSFEIPSQGYKTLNRHFHLIHRDRPFLYYVRLELQFYKTDLSSIKFYWGALESVTGDSLRMVEDSGEILILL